MCEYDGPTYPLDRETFRHAISVGLGRAQVHVREHGALKVRDEILDAATTCKVYDPQVEGLPANWLADLCLAADVVREIVDRQPAGSHWDRRLRSVLLKEFAARGNMGARASLYAECQRVENSSDVYGSSEIVELDGEVGLVYVARKLGALASTQLDFLVDDSVVREFDLLYGNGKGLAVLQSHADGDPAIATFIRGLETSAASDSEHQRPTRRTTQDVVASILNEHRSLYWLGHWGRHASPEELDSILGLLEEKSSPWILENTLRCLSGSRTPPLDPAMFVLLRHSNANVRLFAARSLAHYVQPRIRDEGLAALSFDVSVGLTLLRKNASAYDAPALVEALQPISDVDLRHSVVSDAVDLLKQNANIREPRIAFYVYENSPCMNCRGDAVKWLLEWKSCPLWLREEGVSDASEEIRNACSTPILDAT